MVVLAVVAGGIYLVVEEGSDNDRGRGILHRGAGGWEFSARRGTDSVQDISEEGLEGADYSNDPGLPGWDGIRVYIRDDVPGVVELPEDTGTPEQVGEVDDEQGDFPLPTVRGVEERGQPAAPRPTALPAVPQPTSEGDAGALEEKDTGILCSYPWDCNTAIRVVYGPTVACPTGESGGNPYAVGDEDERGWFQIHPAHWGKPQCNPEFLFDPAYNTACAYSIWEDSGWGPWSCY